MVPSDPRAIITRISICRQIHLTSLVTPYYNHVGFKESDTDAHLTVYSRSDAMSWACRLQVPDCVANANAKYAELMKDPNNNT